ncbi:MAG: hypothetical protein A2Z66_00935 [Chloroflexi bacterium RBG_13_66_10]|nr:MAG: hypothetical protein A2Z66_00935 [Chloroflexi bacterium RBG_13_66_10]
MRSPFLAGLRAFLWAFVATLLEAALQRRMALWRVINVLPLAFGAGIAFVVGRIVGLALTGVF